MHTFSLTPMFKPILAIKSEVFIAELNPCHFYKIKPPIIVTSDYLHNKEEFKGRVVDFQQNPTSNTKD